MELGTLTLHLNSQIQDLLYTKILFSGRAENCEKVATVLKRREYERDCIIEKPETLV